MPRQAAPALRPVAALTGPRLRPVELRLPRHYRTRGVGVHRGRLGGGWQPRVRALGSCPVQPLLGPSARVWGVDAGTVAGRRCVCPLVVGGHAGGWVAPSARPFPAFSRIPGTGQGHTVVR